MTYIKNYTLIITDIEMPGLSGIGLAEKIRKDDIQTRIVFLSSHEKFEYAHSGYKLDISDYILKQAVHIDKSYEKLNKIKQEIVLTKKLNEKPNAV